MAEDWLVGPGRAVAEGALTWLVQSSALLALGLAAGRLVRRAGPAVESAVARTTLAAILLCPVATALLGQLGWTAWSVRLPVAPTVGSVVSVAPLISPTAPAIEPPPAPRRASLDLVEPVSEPLGSIVGVGPDRTAVVPGPAASDQARPNVGMAPTPGGNGGGRAWASALIGPGFLAWVVGASVLLGRLGLGVRALRRLQAASIPAGAGASATCRDLASQLGLEAPEVRVAPLLSGPCLAGWFRPGIFLPDDSADLDGVAEASPELRGAILHELAHLARRDLAWHWLRLVATALLWPQPLVWLLGRRIEATAEEVCDDFVVQAGADRAGYAGLLLRVALRGLPPTAAPSVGMVALRSMLAHRVVRIMDRSRDLSVAAGRRALASILVLGTLGTALAGLLGVAAERGSTQAKAGPVAAAAAVAQQDGPAPAEEIHGRVVGPDGRPVLGATVLADLLEGTDAEPGFDRPQNRFRVVRATPDSEGQFALRVGPGPVGTVVATAPGFGLGYYLKNQPTIRLTAGDEPIRGRVVDLEGRGVAGAHVRLAQAYLITDPAAARKAAEAPGPYEFPFASALGISGEAALPGGVDTDAEGRFTIQGLGRNVRADLEITGPGIARQQVAVVTRPMPRAIPAHELPGQSGFRQAGTYGSEPTVVMPADRPIEGIVRDAATGEAIAGATVTLAQIGGNSLIVEGEIRARTDAAGRYRLLGVPRVDGLKLSVYPPLDRPYFVERYRAIPPQPGSGPLTFDVPLKRGTWVAGRVFDSKTGRPIAASVDYFPMLDNPSARGYSIFDPEIASSVEVKTRYRTDADGRFRVVALPGRGVVTARADERAYRVGVGAEGIAGRTEQGQLPTYSHIFAAMYQAIRPVDVPSGAESLACDLPLDPGGTVTLDLIDEAGQPVTHAAVFGQGPSGADAGDSGLYDRSRVVVGGLEPGQARTVYAWHHARRLGAIVELAPGEPRDGQSRRVVLRPVATVTGRLRNLPPGVQAVVQGDARATENPQMFQGHNIGWTATDADGRFRLDGFPVGGTFRVEARDRATQHDPGGMRPKAFGAFALADGLRVEPGATVDLGEFDASTGHRVEAPAGKPAAQAAPAPASKPAEVPIQGRLVDLEGRPAPGVRVVVRSRLIPKGGDLGPYLDRLRAGEPTYIASRGGEYFVDRDYDIKDGPSTTTDLDGRFRLDGFRPESFVGLLIGGGGGEGAQELVHVAVRAMAPFPAPGWGNQYGPGTLTIYGTEFSRTVAPSRPIAGVIRDAKTKAPLVGVEVRSERFAGSNWVGTATLRTWSDAEGRYRLDGLPKGKDNEILIVPTDDQPYLMQEFKVPDGPGLAPVALDISLDRGIFIEGTLTDAATGRPITEGRLHYFPFLDNKHAQANPAFGRNFSGPNSSYQDRYKTRTDGSFRIVGLPGRGIVGALAFREGRKGDYLQGAGSEEIGGIDKNGHFPTYANPVQPSRIWPTVMAEVDPPADATGPIRVALQVKTGPGVRFRVVDLAGAPVACTEIRGQSSRDSAEWAGPDPIPAEGTVSNLRPDEERMVMFLHDDRKLGRVARFRLGDDKDGPVTVRLEPLATIAGRVFDRDGNPIPSARIHTNLIPGGDFSINLRDFVCDKEGQFAVTEVPVGCEYNLTANWKDRDNENQFAVRKEPVAVRPGATTDGIEIRDKGD